MVCAGDKTKLIIVGTKKLKQSKLVSKNKKISVTVCIIESTHSEKLLGVVVNEDLTWKEHLYGEHWRQEDNAPGIIPQLSQRVGLLFMLAGRLSSKGFNSVSNALFYSKLKYCLEIFGNVRNLLKSTFCKNQMIVSKNNKTTNLAFVTFCRSR